MREATGLQFVAFVEYLEALLGKPVDVLTPAGIQSIQIDRVARSITENRVELLYNHRSVHHSQALAEAVRRGLREPLAL